MNTKDNASVVTLSDAETLDIAGGIPFLAYPLAVVVVAAEMAKEQASEATASAG
jgi:hypothetical protein